MLHPVQISLILSMRTIDRGNNRDNTDDVGLVAPKVGVDSPKSVRYYFHYRVTLLESLCYLSRNRWVV